MRQDAEGGCLCDKIRYQVTSKPIRVTICHCKFCQKSTGGAYLVEPVFNKSDFSVIRGKTKVYNHRSQGSGKLVHIHFCDHCGTKLFLTFERFADVVGVYGGTFDDPNWFERNIDNSKHIFLNVAQQGTIIPAGIKSYQEHATTKDGTPIEPTIFEQPEIIQPE